MADDLSDAIAACPTPAEWRAAMGAFPTGVTIVTSWDGETPVGSTVNAFCSVSLSPPLLLICLDHANPICGPLRSSGVFGINVLPFEGGRALAINFAGAPRPDRFVGLGHRRTLAGAPQLEAAPVFVDCVLEAIHPGGDHLIVIGRGVRTEHVSSDAPLLYHRGGFPAVSLRS